ncbi:cholinesterase precursor [Rhypophila decipiens]|uniref:Carboxylic ester hydrolase n=1 Tax=Rhypophila decipiens TaxID=261697 RepID=A0AAN6Y540_9PEZI|nr:cholinesterase precursor [Rhypophila decipiens]
MILTTTILLLVSLGHAASLQKNSCRSAAEHLKVDTSNGPIIGHISPNTSCVVEFLGIPYARPPIGDLRFAPPEKLALKTSPEPYAASKYGFDCPLNPSKPVNGYPGFTPQAQRIINNFASAAGTPQSEDCLTLNIWTRAPTSPQSSHAASKSNGKPVLVFFYGGRFTIGNTNTPFYTGKYFAQSQDIVIVTVNYRLNIFGFPGGPDTTSQNLGLRDQRAAVEWIRDNIASFGGDPSKITISGQSSGGVSVDYWAYAYRHDPIVNGIIAHSGNAFSFPANSKSIQQSNWDAVVKAANCSRPSDSTSAASQNDSNQEEIKCMRSLPYQTILAATSALKPAKSSSILRSIPPFWPTPDSETVFSAQEYISLTGNRSFAKIPMLLGNTHNENGYYQIAAFASQGILPTQAQIDSFILESFTCPVKFQAEGRRKFGVPAYMYRYFADWEILRLFEDTTTGITSGAYHGVDLHMLFGNGEEVSGLGGSPEEASRRRELTKLMQRAWFVFADDPLNGLRREFGWSGFSDKEGRTLRSLASLGQENRPDIRFEDPSVYDGDCGNVTMGALGGAS